jgi:peroxiredoxin
MDSGSPAPDFVLPDTDGRQRRLGDFLSSGPVVLAFHRGTW